MICQICQIIRPYCYVTIETKSEAQPLLVFFFSL